MNAESSRSHCVVEMRITHHMAGNPEDDGVSLLTLVDLAGSESGATRRALNSANEMRVQREGRSINLSLSAVNKLVRQIARADRAGGGGGQGARQVAAAARGSQLTRLLSGPLTGKAKIVLVAAVSPHADDAAQTVRAPGRPLSEA